MLSLNNYLSSTYYARGSVLGIWETYEVIVEEEMAMPSSILAWKIPWTEESGGLQSTGSQRVGHDWARWSNSTWAAFWEALEHVPAFLFTSVSSTPQQHPTLGICSIIQWINTFFQKRILLVLPISISLSFSLKPTLPPLLSCNIS